MGAVIPPLRPGDVLGERYRLEDDIRIRPQAQIWRGRDERLGRSVGIRVIAADSPVAPTARQAAMRAASVHSRLLLPVLDIAEQDGTTAFVTDWTDWPTLSYIAREPLSPRSAIDLAIAVCQALTVLSDAGLSHGRLSPNVVHVDGIGQVKLRGFQLDAALHGQRADQQLWRRWDATGVLGLMYLCLTGTWPEVLAAGPTAADVATIPPPSRLVADIPTSLDEFVGRGMIEAARGELGLRDIAMTLAVLREELVDRRAAASRRGARLRVALRTAAVAVVGLGIVGLTMAGITQAAQEEGARGVTMALDTNDGVVSSPEGSTVRLNPDERPLPINGMTTLDPDGDGVEYPYLLPNIIDDDPGTAWTTKAYFTADVGGKRGVGVVFDLGAAQKVSAIDLELTGTSTDFTVLVGQEPYGPFESFLPVTDARGAGQSVFVRLPREVAASAVLVWFTKMSENSDSSWDAGHRAGIRSATIYGSAADAP